MAKALKTIGIVVGAIGLVATGVGALAAAGAFGAGVGAAAFASVAMTVGTIASVVSAVAMTAGSLLTPRPSFQSEGSPLDFTTNPNSGLPYVIGRTRMSGLKIRAALANSAGGDGVSDLLFFGALLSCAPVLAVESFSADNVVIDFDGSSGAALADYSGWMAQRVSLGPMPQTTALSLNFGGVNFPGITSAHTLSGMAHAAWALKFDKDGHHFQGGPPEPAWVLQGGKCYDPRKDGTYPGGSGSHRSNDEATWEWTRNGALHALTWCIGHFANGKKVAGIGAPIGNIRVADFVEAANVADANGWGVGGVEYTTDSKWDTLTRMLQAAGAVPTKSAAMIGCRVMCPRTSIVTIPAADLLGDLTYPATKPRRDRFNTVLPRYASEAHNWEVITGSAISVADYVTADGGRRTKGIDFPLVQAELAQPGYDGHQQVGQLSRYAIENSREAGPVELTTGLKYIGVHCGDCVTLDAPTEGFSSVKLVITGRQVDIAAAQIRWTAETETDGKHAFALGSTTTPPPAPTLTTPPPSVTVPDGADWSVTPVALADGQAGLRIAGTIGDPVADTVLVDISPAGAGTWRAQAALAGAGPLTVDVGPLDSLASWDVRLAYSANGRRGDYLVISGVDSGASAILSRLGAVARRGTVFPNAAASDAGQIFIRTDLDNRPFLRVEGDGLLTIGGVPVLIGGAPVEFCVWEEVRDLGVLDALADAQAALDQIGIISSDSWLSAGEKATAIRLHSRLSESFDKASAKATDLGQAATENADATAAMAALDAYLAGLSPAWDDAGAGDTPIVKVDWDAIWKDAEIKVPALEFAIQGIPGADGIVAETTGPVSYAVPCNADGSIQSGALTAAAGTLRLKRVGTGLITSGVTNFEVISTTNCGATINSATGAYTFSTVSADLASATFRCLYGGLYYQLTVSLNKVRDGRSAEQTTGSGSATNLTASTYGAAVVTLDITVPNGASLAVSAHEDYEVNSYAESGNSFYGKLKITYQNLTDAGAETDLDAQVGTQAFSIQGLDAFSAPYWITSPGYADASGTVTNATGASKVYRIKAYIARDSGDVGGNCSVIFSGTVG